MAKKKSTLQKTSKKVTKKAIKQAKKGKPGLLIFIIIVCLVIGVGAAIVFIPFNGQSIYDKYIRKDNHTSQISTQEFNGVKYDEFQINFLEVGNWNTGDAVFIKAGNNDILIDAGSNYTSVDAIESFIDANCSDKKLEYVIATHAHEDHIAGFSGGSSKNGVLYKYDIGTIIEFAQTDSTAKVYTNYVDARNYAVSKGAKVYTALEAYNDTSLRTISLGEGMSMTTLYQKYYEEKASTENDYSVCTLFTYNQQHYLFTGDLESGGESSLVDRNDIPKCELYKAGHHGSKTSSSNKLMEKVQPKVVCCCCCCGNDEYTKTNANQFPTQEFVNRVAPYTANIYVTTISIDNEQKKYASMNGTICFSSNGKDYSVACTNNNTVLKDTEWFKKNRTWPTA